MYGWNRKSMREGKSNKNTETPSFSSTLLDEIYRSMDGGDEKSGEFKRREEKIAKKQNGGGARAKGSSVVEEEGIVTLRRAFLVEKWMDMKGNVSGRTKPPSSLPEFDRKLVVDNVNDPLFFSSGSSSSDSSYGWVSEQDGFCESRSHKVSCFVPFSKPRPIKTYAFSKKHEQIDLDYCSSDHHETNKIDHGALIKSKARALKIYARLKKVKQPISPGGRLTSFLNSLFANGHLKKQKDLNSEDKKMVRTAHGSTCSSASSFTRSCLSKHSPRSREKLNNGIRRTVRFYPVSIIIDEDSRPCGKKFIRDEHNFTEERKSNDDDDDTASDSSSDLFELDHLSILKDCEELPVYETTHFGTNRAIANGLIC